MRIIKYLTSIFFLILTLSGFSQENDAPLIDPMLIRLQARILSAGDSSAVPYANIINNRTHSGTITNADGFFTFEMLNIDSLVVSSVGFEKSVLKVPYNYNGLETLTFLMLPVNYALREVNVKGEKPEVDLGFETGKPINLAPELRGDAYNESPPILAAFFNPASYLQYYLSKREKRKREVRKAMTVQKNWEMHSENYNKEMVMRLTGLNELEADSFMLWFNAQDVLPYTSSEYQVRASIIEYYHYYMLEKNMKPPLTPPMDGN